LGRYKDTETRGQILYLPDREINFISDLSRRSSLSEDGSDGSFCFLASQQKAKYTLILSVLCASAVNIGYKYIEE
jgi:hypothetical protein